MKVLKHIMIWGLKAVILKYYYSSKYSNVIFDYLASAKNTLFEGKNRLRVGAKLMNSKIGIGSYISENSQLKNIKIGRFCCIGNNVKNGFAQHPSKVFVSIHPAFYSNKSQAGFSFSKFQKFIEHKYIDEKGKYYNEIGHDVWIGSNVLIMEGTTIGNGAIIAAGSIVTRDIQPYEIVGGVPIKNIAYRFTKNQIDILENYKWWNKNIEWISRNAKLFQNIEVFIKYIKTNK